MKKVYLVLLLILVTPLVVFAEDDNVYLKNEYDTVTLSKCVDGNSARFILGDNEIKVKFLAINSDNVIKKADEDETNGSLVSYYVCSLFENANDIKIEYEPNSDKEDKYGRILAWVYVDGYLLQEHLLKLGYAQIAYLYDDYSYNDILVEAEQYAKDKKLGIWEKEDSQKSNEELSYNETKEEKKDNIFTIIFNFIGEIFEKFMDFIDKIMNEML